MGVCVLFFVDCQVELVVVFSDHLVRSLAPLSGRCRGVGVCGGGLCDGLWWWFVVVVCGVGVGVGVLVFTTLTQIPTRSTVVSPL